MTIPAATNLIVNLFPEPALQEIAIAIFGGECRVCDATLRDKPLTLTSFC